MLVLNAEEIAALCPPAHLVNCLEEAFRKDYLAPKRAVVRFPGENTERVLLCMPAFDADGSGAVKLTTVFPGNNDKGMPAIQGAILVFSQNGTPVALLDGAMITRLRTAAASALAARYLARSDSSHLAIVGTGALAPAMIAAHCAERPIARVTICGRESERAEATAAAARTLIDQSVELVVSPSIEQAVIGADIVSCATSSPAPVLHEKWLRPGAFVDLVGSFSPSKREADDDTVLRSRIFVDTFEGALAEAGDILDPLTRKVIDRSRIEGELADLVRGTVRGRTNAEEITLFKSVGTAIEDLAASRLVVAAATRKTST